MIRTLLTDIYALLKADAALTQFVPFHDTFAAKAMNLSLTQIITQLSIGNLNKSFWSPQKCFPLQFVLICIFILIVES